EPHRVIYFLYAALLAMALLAWWLIDRSRFGLGLKAIREDEDKAETLGTPTFAYKLIFFVVFAFSPRWGGCRTCSGRWSVRSWSAARWSTSRCPSATPSCTWSRPACCSGWS